MRVKTCPHCLKTISKDRFSTGPFNTREELRAEVLKQYKAWVPGKEIAKRLGISGPTVSRILHGDKSQNSKE